MTGPGRPTEIWISPAATSFSCLCEPCLDGRSRGTDSFLDAIEVSVVRGSIPLETDVAFARCRNGHELVVRRSSRPPNLAVRDPRQLELA